MNPVFIRTALAAALSFATVSASSAPAVWPPPMAPAAEQIDAIRVDKSERKMELLRGGKVVRRYRVMLGDAPVGAKHQQGDERTPEGRYTITFRNGASRYHLSLRVSYPDEADRAWATEHGVDPGGDAALTFAGTPPSPIDASSVIEQSAPAVSALQSACQALAVCEERFVEAMQDLQRRTKSALHNNPKLNVALQKAGSDEEIAAVGRERDGTQFRSLPLEPADELGRKMLGIGRRAPIAAGEHLAPAGHTSQDGLNGSRDGFAQRLG